MNQPRQPRLFFTSDQHFFHKNIIKYCDRPFSVDDEGVKECIEYIVKTHNNVVKEDDVVVWVGDISMHKPHQREFVKRIIQAHNGRKILFMGNHDKESMSFYNELFERVIKDYEIIDGWLICHYPVTPHEYSRKSELKVLERIYKDLNFQDVHTIIHGHTHEKNANKFAKDGIRRINVCVDYPDNYFEPVEMFDDVLLQHFVTKKPE